MSAEITNLKRVNNNISEEDSYVIEPEGINGREIGLSYLLDDLGFERRHPGKLLVHEKGTTLWLYTDNWNSGTELFDVDDKGRKVPIIHQWKHGGLDLRVIETEIWRNDIGVRIRHVSNDV